MPLERILETEVMDDPSEAAAYDAMDHSQPNEAFVSRLLELGAGGRMLDVGTGPGDMPVMLCGLIADTHIVAIDAAASMLEFAKSKIVQANLGDRIELRQADAKSLPFEDTSFDTVYSNTILHHIEDPVPMLREARRVLKPDGCLLIRDLFRPADEQMLDALVEAHGGEEPTQRRLFRDSLHAAFTPEEIRQLADAAGLSDAEIIIDTDRHMSLQRARASS